MKNKQLRHSLTEAKLYATLNYFFGYSLKEVRKIINLYELYRLRINDMQNVIQKYDLRKSLSNEAVAILNTNNVFYSFCFGFYKWLPAILAVNGYKTIVLVSNPVYESQHDIIMHGIHLLECKYGRRMPIEILGIGNRNILFTLRNKVAQGYKVIVFVDGNMGITESTYVSGKYSINNRPIEFHSGYGCLIHMTKQQYIYGLICDGQNNSLSVKIFQHLVPQAPSLRDKFKNINHMILDDLRQTIDHKEFLWDCIPSLYQWAIIDDDKRGYTSLSNIYPFVMEQKLYAINLTNFMVFPIPVWAYIYLRIRYAYKKSI